MTFDFEPLVKLAWTQLWQVTALAVGIGMAARVCCGNRPHLAYVLWMLVIVKCVTPPLWTSTTGVFSWANSTASAPPPAARVEAPLPIDSAAPRSHLGTAPIVREAAEPIVTFPPESRRRAPQSRRVWLGIALLLAWACGSVSFAGLVVIKRVQFERRLRHSREATDAALERLAADLSRRLGIRRAVRLQVTSEPLGPAVSGVFRPTILLPQAVVEGRSPEELSPILAHELIHIRRHDPAVGWLQLPTLCMWWFHPLVWWANRCLGRERERCCDEAVVAGLSLDPGIYGQCLIDVLKSKRQLQPVFALSGVRPFEITQRRLEHIMNHTRGFHSRMPRRHWITFVVGLMLVIPGAGFTRPASVAENVTASDERPRPDGTEGSSPDQDAAIDDAARPGGDGPVIVPAGVCDDGEGGVVAGADVVLYRVDHRIRRQQVLERTRSDAEGRFRFSTVPGHPEEMERYGITATAPGRASYVRLIPTPWQPSDQMRVSMPPAGVLTGRILDLDGRPVVGAKVWIGSGLPEPVVGVRCAETDEAGDYAIDDIALAKKGAWAEPIPLPGGESFAMSSPPRVYCRHPDFVYTWVGYESVPGEADFVLQPAGVIAGRFVYAETGEPAPGVGVGAQSVAEGDFSMVLTDEQGRYRLGSLRQEKYNVWTEVEGWTAPAIDSMDAVSGKTLAAPDFELVGGGIVRGRLVDAHTGEPIRYADFVAPIQLPTRPYIAVKGPARPWSGGGQMATKFREDGSYEFRVPPGDNFVNFILPSPWRLVRPSVSSDPSRPVPASFDRSIALSVDDGETIELDLEVARLAQD